MGQIIPVGRTRSYDGIQFPSAQVQIIEMEVLAAMALWLRLVQ
jgi:hypothetical protein